MTLRTLSIMLVSIAAVGAVADDTRGYMSALSDFLESHALGDTELNRIIDGCNKGEMVNPILQSAADINPLTLVYREVLQSWITPGKLDAAAVCEFAKSRLSDEAREKDERNTAKEATRELAPIPPTTLAAGDHFTCAIQEDHTAVCWGYNRDQIETPPELGPVKSISAGSHRVCFIRWGDTVGCWRLNYPIQYILTESYLGTAKALSVGKDDRLCVIHLDNTATCQLDQNFQGEDPLEPVIAIARGPTFAFAIRADHVLVYGWGPNVGYGNELVKAVAVGGGIVCTIRLDDTLDCGQNVAFSPPSDLGPVRSVSIGNYHACAIRRDHTLACWRDKNFNYPYTGQATDIPADLGPVKEVAVGRWHTCARKQDNTIACWGSNEHKQLISPWNLPTPSATPTVRWWMQVPGVSQIFNWLNTPASSGAAQ